MGYRLKRKKNVERLIRVLETLSFILNLFYLIHLLFSGRGGLVVKAVVDERLCADKLMTIVSLLDWGYQKTGLGISETLG